VVAQIQGLFPPADPVTVERVWGSDRIQTSVNVAGKTLGLSSQTPLSPPGFAFIANAYNFPDALSASPMAAGNLVPIFLTGANTLDPRVDAALTNFAITDVVIVGGTSVISPGIESYLKSKLGPTRVLRLSGSDRYETSKEFATWAGGYPGATITVGTPGNPNALMSADWNRIGLATGENFPDALAAGPFCGDEWAGVPRSLLLTPGNGLSKWVFDTHNQLGPGETSYFEDIWSLGGTPKVYRSYIFGGSSVLSDQTWWELGAQS
jgi:hypothetical protein